MGARREVRGGLASTFQTCSNLQSACPFCQRCRDPLLQVLLLVLLVLLLVLWHHLCHICCR
jgi:hypothetical protein